MFFFLSKHFSYAYPDLSTKSTRMISLCNCQSVLKGSKSFLDHIRKVHLEVAFSNEVNLVSRINNDDYLIQNNLENPSVSHNEPKNC